MSDTLRLWKPCKHNVRFLGGRRRASQWRDEILCDCNGNRWVTLRRVSRHDTFEINVGAPSQKRLDAAGPSLVCTGRDDLYEIVGGHR